MRKVDRAIAAAFAFWTESGELDVAAIASVSLRRRRLTLRIPNASSRYEIDRLLRGGLERATIERTPAAITEIRVKA
jgi:hypothetical protein